MSLGYVLPMNAAYGLIAAFVLLAAIPAVASDSPDELEKRGYEVRFKTTIEGVYRGCHTGEHLQLENTWEFVCRDNHIGFGWDAPVVILRHKEKGYFRYFIDGEETEGALIIDDPKVQLPFIRDDDEIVGEESVNRRIAPKPKPKQF